MLCVTRSSEAPSIREPQHGSVGTWLPLHCSRKAIYYWAWAPSKAQRSPLQTLPWFFNRAWLGGLDSTREKNICNRQHDWRQVNSTSRPCLLQHLHTLRRKVCFQQVAMEPTFPTLKPCTVRPPSNTEMSKDYPNTNHESSLFKAVKWCIFL